MTTDPGISISRLRNGVESVLRPRYRAKYVLAATVSWLPQYYLVLVFRSARRVLGRLVFRDGLRLQRTTVLLQAGTNALNMVALATLLGTQLQDPGTRLVASFVEAAVRQYRETGHVGHLDARCGTREGVDFDE